MLSSGPYAKLVNIQIASYLRIAISSQESSIFNIDEIICIILVSKMSIVYGISFPDISFLIAINKTIYYSLVND